MYLSIGFIINGKVGKKNMGSVPMFYVFYVFLLIKL